MGSAFSQVVKGIGAENLSRSVSQQIEQLSISQSEISKQILLSNEKHANEYNRFFNTIINEFKAKFQHSIEQKQNFFIQNGLRFVVPYKHVFSNRIYKDNNGTTLLQYITQHVQKRSVQENTNLIKNGKILVNGLQAETGYCLQNHDVVAEIVDLRMEPAIYDHEIAILDENADYFAIDKPASMSVKTSGLCKKNSVYNSIDALRGDQRFVYQTSRLPRTASGVIFLMKKDSSKLKQQAQLCINTLELAYARVGGKVPTTMNLQWKEFEQQQDKFSEAQSLCKVVVTALDYDKKSNTTLIKIHPEHRGVSMKQHRIRFSLMKAGHPIINDIDYTQEFASNPYLMSQVEKQLQKEGQLAYKKDFESEIIRQTKSNLQLMHIKSSGPSQYKGSSKDEEFNAAIDERMINVFDVNRCFEMFYHEQEHSVEMDNMELIKYQSKIQPLWMDAMHLADGYYFDKNQFYRERKSFSNIDKIQAQW